MANIIIKMDLVKLDPAEYYGTFVTKQGKRVEMRIFESKKVSAVSMIWKPKEREHSLKHYEFDNLSKSRAWIEKSFVDTEVKFQSIEEFNHTQNELVKKRVEQPSEATKEKVKKVSKPNNKEKMELNELYRSLKVMKKQEVVGFLKKMKVNFNKDASTKELIKIAKKEYKKYEKK